MTQVVADAHRQRVAMRWAEHHASSYDVFCVRVQAGVLIGGRWGAIVSRRVNPMIVVAKAAGISGQPLPAGAKDGMHPFRPVGHGFMMYPERTGDRNPDGWAKTPRGPASRNACAGLLRECPEHKHTDYTAAWGVGHRAGGRRTFASLRAKVRVVAPMISGLRKVLLCATDLRAHDRRMLPNRSALFNVSCDVVDRRSEMFLAPNPHHVTTLRPD